MKKFLVYISILMLVSGCSVYMAAKKSGTSVEEVSKCKTRACVLSKGAVLIKKVLWVRKNSTLSKSIMTKMKILRN